MKRTLISTAVTCVIAFLLLHVFGFRDYVSVLSGTPGPGGESGVFAAATGLLYAIAWFSAVLVAPVLVLSVAIDHVMGAFVQRRRVFVQRRASEGC